MGWSLWVLWGPVCEEFGQEKGVVCERNGAWQPVRGLCQTSSGRSSWQGQAKGLQSQACPPLPRPGCLLSSSKSCRGVGEFKGRGYPGGEGDSEGTAREGDSHDQEWEQQLGLFPGKPQGLVARVEVGGGGSDEGKGRRKGKGERREGGEGGGENRDGVRGQRREAGGVGGEEEREERGPVGRGC